MFSKNSSLIAAIEQTVALLKSSQDSDWSNLTAKQIKQILETELRKIKDKQEFDKHELAALFAAASNVQEIAMSNDWHKEYLEIAEVIDKHTN